MIYVLSFIAPLLVWPVIWTDARFLIPIIPFLWILLVKIRNREILRVIFCGLIVSMLITSYTHREKSSDYDREYIDLCRHVPNATFVSRKPAIFSYYSGAKSMAYQYTTDTDAVRKEILRADYILFEPNYPTAKYLLPVIKNFKMVWAGNYMCVVEVPKCPIR